MKIVSFYDALSAKVRISILTLMGKDLKRDQLKDELYYYLYNREEVKFKAKAFKLTHLDKNPNTGLTPPLQRLNSVGSGYSPTSDKNVVNAIKVREFKGVIDQLLSRLIDSEGRVIHSLFKDLFTECVSTKQLLAKACILRDYWDEIHYLRIRKINTTLIHNISCLSEEEEQEIKDLQKIINDIAGVVQPAFTLPSLSVSQPTSSDFDY